jgi:hypothetical protein
MKSGIPVCLLSETKQQTAKLFATVRHSGGLDSIYGDKVRLHLLLTENLPRTVVGPSRKLFELS